MLRPIYRFRSRRREREIAGVHICRSGTRACPLSGGAGRRLAALLVGEAGYVIAPFSRCGAASRSVAAMQQWEIMYLDAYTNNMKRVAEEASRLGALGWEPVGIASADKTLGLNVNMLNLKCPITPPPPPPATNEEWQPDPTGRYDKRRWDAELGVWTEQVAMMEAKTTHIDSPRM